MAAKNPQFSEILSTLVIKKKGWSKQEFAELANIHYNSATNYLENGVVPEWDILVRIAKILDVSIDFFFTEDPGQYKKDLFSYTILEAAKAEYQILNEEELSIIEAIRLIDDKLIKRSVYMAVIMQFNDALKDKKIKKNHLKSMALEKAVHILGKAISDTS